MRPNRQNVKRIPPGRHAACSQARRQPLGKGVSVDRVGPLVSVPVLPLGDESAVVVPDVSLKCQSTESERSRLVHF